MKKKILWVTGASTGIGREIAKLFSKNDFIVVATARRKSRLVSLVQEIKFAGNEASAFVCDVSSERSVFNTFKRIKERYGQIDVLVNNAGVTSFKSFADSKIYDFDYMMDINLRGSFLCIKSVLPQMLKKRKGHIINILSVAVHSKLENSSLYAASKAGLLAMSDGLRLEVRGYNIKVTNIMPGAVDTPMWDSRTRQKKRNRMMTPEDIASVVFDVVNKPNKLQIEEVVLRPQKGDL
ncbi:MAG: SDR family oxidoreductase [Ignavibacteria bacterium]|nr:SDR family oxidoreductase [Ignavibacteria bacterium]